MYSTKQMFLNHARLAREHEARVKWMRAFEQGTVAGGAFKPGAVDWKTAEYSFAYGATVETAIANAIRNANESTSAVSPEGFLVNEPDPQS